MKHTCSNCGVQIDYSEVLHGNSLCSYCYVHKSQHDKQIHNLIIQIIEDKMLVNEERLLKIANNNLNLTYERASEIIDTVEFLEFNYCNEELTNRLHYLLRNEE